MVLACSTAHVTSDCLDVEKNDIEHIKDEYFKDQLTPSETVNILSDHFGLLEAMELNNHLFKTIDHNYCDADFNQVRWDIQSEIDYIISVNMGKKNGASKTHKRSKPRESKAQATEI